MHTWRLVAVEAGCFNVGCRFIQSVTVGESPFILAAGATGDSSQGATWGFTCSLTLYLALLGPCPGHQVTTSTSPDLTASQIRYSLQQNSSSHSKVPPWIKIKNIFSSRSKNQNDVEQAGGRWVIRPSEGKQQPAQPLIRCLGIHHKFCVHSRNLVAAHLASCHPTTDSIYFYLGQIFLSTI